MAQMASERGKELMCFLRVTMNVGPSLMNKMGNACKMYYTRLY
jgi:hypothetical protein